MPKDEPNPNPNANGETPKQELPEELHFDRREMKCQKCQQIFAHFIIEEIDDLTQLRCGDVLISKCEMVCMHCGWVFHWEMSKKALSATAVIHGKLTGLAKGYRPE